jgi:hypothetical protein
VGLTYFDFIKSYSISSIISSDRPYENIWIEGPSFETFIRLYFDVEKLFEYNIELSEIAAHITNQTPECRYSPTFMGMIDLLTDGIAQNILPILDHLKMFSLGDENIKNCDIMMDYDGYMLATIGSSIVKLCEFEDMVVLDSIRSNDIRDVYNTFGIEAARELIADLLEDKDGIIADFMTRSGEIVPITKASLLKYNRGFISTAFFERFGDSVKLLQDSPVDPLETVYSRIFMGLNINNALEEENEEDF